MKNVAAFLFGDVGEVNTDVISSGESRENATDGTYLYSLKVFITARLHLFDSIVIVFLPGTNSVFCDCSRNFQHVTVNTCVLPVAKLLCMTWLLMKTRFCVWTGQKQG